MKEFSLLYLGGSTDSDFKILRHEIIHAETIVCARNQFEHNILKSIVSDHAGCINGLSKWYDRSRVYVSVVQPKCQTQGA